MGSLGTTLAITGNTTDAVASGVSSSVAVEDNAGTRANPTNTIQQLRTDNYYRLTREYEQLTGKRYPTITGPNYQPSQEAINSLQREIEQIGREEGAVPFNYAPIGAGRSGAFNQARRDTGVPTSQQGRLVPNIDRRGNVQPGRAYEFTNGRGQTVIIRNDLSHVYPDNPAQNRGTHFNTPRGDHYDY